MLLSLPNELRNKIYELALVQEDLIDPWNYGGPLKDFTLGLLRVNRTILREASSILYAQNRFNIAVDNARDMTLFLEQIGSRNASSIQHICIKFPSFILTELGHVGLHQDSQGILADIDSYCTNLRTLTTTLDSTNAAELDLEGFRNTRIVDEAMELVHVAFKAFASTPEIIVEVSKDGPNGYARQLMRSHGWTVNEKEYVEEEVEDDDYWYQDYVANLTDDDYDEEIDIENDSDFGRRTRRLIAAQRCEYTQPLRGFVNLLRDE